MIKDKLSMAMKGVGLVVSIVVAASALATAQDRRSLDDELDKFAASVFDEIQPRSIAENLEYCGLLGLGASGKFAATKAKRGQIDDCEPENEPDGFRVLASYHTHGAYTPDVDTEVPSLDDLQADIEERIEGYIATPGGRLWLNDPEDRKSYQLCGPGCVVADKKFRACKAYLPAKSYTLRTLKARADNDTGEC